MSSKLLIIIATGEREKALTALMYARNAQRGGQFAEVRVVFFGPVEKLITVDEVVAEKAAEVASGGEALACRAISDREGISDTFERMGVRVEYVGSIISNYITEGYVPMVW